VKILLAIPFPLILAFAVPLLLDENHYCKKQLRKTKLSSEPMSNDFPPDRDNGVAIGLYSFN
jgi:hypothetical protein